MGIGKRIKEVRLKKGLTQEELARLVGVTKGAIANYEKETSHPKEPVMYAFFKALDVEPNYLFQDCIDSLKKAPAPAEASTGVNEIDAQRLYEMLLEQGFIEANQDLSDEDLHFLLSMAEIVRAWFAKGEK